MNGRVVASLVILGALVGCAATTPVTVNTPGPSGSATVSPTAEASPSRAPALIARKAVYQLDGVLWLYDVQSDAISALTEPARVRLPRWMDANRISFVRDASNGRASALLVLDLSSRKIEQLFQVATGIATYGWSPDLDTVGYVTVDEFDYPQIHYRSIGSGAVRTVATLTRQFGREFIDDDQLRVEFSPDGGLVLIVYTVAEGQGEVAPDESQLQIRGTDGSLVYAADQQERPTMGVWAPDGSALYHRIDRGARAWLAAGGSTRGVPGSPVWFNPTVSPNGRRIAFDTGTSDAEVRVRLLDLRGGGVSNLSKRGRGLPVFATDRTVWAQRVRACRGDCFVPTELVSQVYAIDVRSGDERELAIRSLADVDVLYG